MSKEVVSKKNTLDHKDQEASDSCKKEKNDIISEPATPDEASLDHEDEKKDGQSSSGGLKNAIKKSKKTRPKPTKVISKGHASLIISRVENEKIESKQPKALAPEPRRVTKKLEEPQIQTEEQTETIIQRLENKAKPGQERVKVEKAKFEKLEKRPDEAQKQEEEWGKGLTPGWWVSMGGVAAAVFLLGALAIESWFDGDNVESVEPKLDLLAAEADPFEGSPEQWFHRRAGSINKEATAILSAFINARNTSARSKFVRNPRLYMERASSDEYQVRPRLSNTDDIILDIDHTGDTGFLTLDGQDEDFFPFRAYFTREKDQLKIDWSATVAWSEASLSQIKKDIVQHQSLVDKLNKDYQIAIDSYSFAMAKRKELINAKQKQAAEKKGLRQLKVHAVIKGENLSIIARKYGVSLRELMEHNRMPNDFLRVGQKLEIPGAEAPYNEPEIVVPPEPAAVSPPVYPKAPHMESVLVRCLIRRRNEFYSGPYNDQEHSAYVLSSPDVAHYMWAYTQRDSDLDIALRKLLDHGRFVVDLKKDIRVTVRVKRGKKDALPSQLELVELVHPEWVTPDESTVKQDHDN